jgi:hypothetical protein
MEAFNFTVRSSRSGLAIPEPQESAENKYLGHRMLFKLENQRSHRRKALITKII